MRTFNTHYKYEFEMALPKSKTPMSVEVFADDLASAKRELEEAIKHVSVNDIVIRRISQV